MTWQPPTLEMRNGLIRQYKIIVVELYSGKITSHMSLQSQTTLDGLHPHYTYSDSVAAVTISAGPFSENVTFTTLQARELGQCGFSFSFFFFIHTSNCILIHTAVLTTCHHCSYMPLNMLVAVD